MKRMGRGWIILASYTLMAGLVGCSEAARQADLGGLPTEAGLPVATDCPRGPAPDAGTIADAAVTDAMPNPNDAGKNDAAPADAGTNDAAPNDAGPADTGTTTPADAAAADAALPEPDCDAGAAAPTPALLRIEYGARDTSDPSTGFYKIEPRFFVPDDCAERPLAATEPFSCTIYECRQPFAMPRNPPSPPKPLLGDLQIRGRAVVTLFPIPSMSAYKTAERDDATLPLELGSLRTTPLVLTSSLQPSNPFDVPIPIAIEFTTTKAELGLVQRTAPPSISWQRPLVETEIKSEIEFSIETDRRRVRCVFPSQVSPKVLPSSVFRELNSGAYTVSLGTRVRSSIVRPGINLTIEAVRIGNAAGVPLRRVEGTIN